MAEVDPNMGKDSKEAKSRLEDIKYYTSLFLGTLCIVCVFGFLFLVPFVLDPAISTLMHDFIEQPVHCKVSNYSLRFGKRQCKWASCKEGCTATIFKCHQIRVLYTPNIPFKNDTLASDIPEAEWSDLTRIERPEDPDTNEPLGIELIVDDTPLLINIKGCGYPPEVDCDLYAEKYENHSMNDETFPCYYSQVNRWIVLSEFDKDEMVTSIVFSIMIPNGLLVLSLVILVYWYCPYCQAKCRKYEEQTNLRDNDYESELDEYHDRPGDN